MEGSKREEEKEKEEDRRGRGRLGFLKNGRCRMQLGKCRI